VLGPVQHLNSFLQALNANAANKVQSDLKPKHPKQFRCWTPTACTYTVSGSISLPSPGFFSPFPHGTGSLSVSQEYLALEDGPPVFSQDTSCPDLLAFTGHRLSNTGLSPSMVRFSNLFF
jgi:hypothetical protein